MTSRGILFGGGGFFGLGMNGKHPFRRYLDESSRDGSTHYTVLPPGRYPADLRPLVNGCEVRADIVSEGPPSWPARDQKLDGVVVLHAGILDASSSIASWKLLRWKFRPEGLSMLP
jgi:hypothetical protein